MRNSIKLVGLTMIMVLALSGTAMAAGTQLRTKTQDRLKDGSCIAALKTKTRDRLKDGTCVAAGDKLRTRSQDRLRDGSCLVG